MIPGYDNWKTSPPAEPKPITRCAICGKDMYEGEVLYTVDGGICEECLADNYKEFVKEE